MTSMERCYQLIQKAVITEKATDDTAGRNAYHFRVPMEANKVEIRQAVHRLFGVDVIAVNTTRVRGKGRRRRYAVGQTPDWKKAMVTLAEGQSIEIL